MVTSGSGEDFPQAAAKCCRGVIYGVRIGAYGGDSESGYIGCGYILGSAKLGIPCVAPSIACTGEFSEYSSKFTSST